MRISYITYLKILAFIIKFNLIMGKLCNIKDVLTAIYIRIIEVINNIFNIITGFFLIIKSKLCPPYKECKSACCLCTTCNTTADQIKLLSDY